MQKNPFNMAHATSHMLFNPIILPQLWLFSVYCELPIFITFLLKLIEEISTINHTWKEYRFIFQMRLKFLVIMQINW